LASSVVTTRVAVKGSVSDHAAATVVEVEHGCEAEVDAAGPQLGRQHQADGGGGVGGEQRVLHPQLAQLSHRRQRG
jgi:hypothetical protein